jgi:hypothetical protein
MAMSLALKVVFTRFLSFPQARGRPVLRAKRAMPQRRSVASPTPLVNVDASRDGALFQNEKPLATTSARRRTLPIDEIMFQNMIGSH